MYMHSEHSPPLFYQYAAQGNLPIAQEEHLQPVSLLHPFARNVQQDKTKLSSEKLSSRSEIETAQGNKEFIGPSRASSPTGLFMLRSAFRPTVSKWDNGSTESSRPTVEALKMLERSLAQMASHAADSQQVKILQTMFDLRPRQESVHVTSASHLARRSSDQARIYPTRQPSSSAFPPRESPLAPVDPLLAVEREEAAKRQHHRTSHQVCLFSASSQSLTTEPKKQHTSGSALQKASTLPEDSDSDGEVEDEYECNDGVILPIRRACLRLLSREINSLNDMHNRSRHAPSPPPEVLTARPDFTKDRDTETNVLVRENAVKAVWDAVKNRREKKVWTVENTRMLTVDYLDRLCRNVTWKSLQRSWADAQDPKKIKTNRNNKRANRLAQRLRKKLARRFAACEKFAKAHQWDPTPFVTEDLMSEEVSSVEDCLSETKYNAWVDSLSKRLGIRKDHILRRRLDHVYNRLDQLGDSIPIGLRVHCGSTHHKSPSQCVPIAAIGVGPQYQHVEYGPGGRLPDSMVNQSAVIAEADLINLKKCCAYSVDWVDLEGGEVVESHIRNGDHRLKEIEWASERQMLETQRLVQFAAAS
ncbi:hypothetical protein CALCODRAFT_510355 [Calocera cornea HHB12733]|uniref:Uncharacterized protein n=1 Tax=Calocera cornea HHB12733 TaxID=1353952 RepID=A0A165EJZ2_9BASI|nr:hypothetical protein CALCODRAFT_510355 [Calocera cornea HHB12733]